MIYNYKFTNKSKEDLDEILKYISIELSNKTAAKNLYKEIIKSIDEICSFPEIGSTVENKYIKNLNIRKKLIKNFIMYYLPDKSTNTNIIVRIVYNKRDINKILENLNLD